ncbi:alpha/beta hydrolase family protein [Streptomyces carpaticus]|uniref:Alpha/beta hydrolase family protein n=1 Tax=Streptomyces carpaticus TaxID=285558 RepID=A0ABV4ZFR0_9ACTN
MAMRRRTFLNLSAATAVGTGVTLLGAGQAHAAPAPAQPYAVGVRRYDWTRGSRPLTTYVYYPATGTPGGDPVTDAPVADGVFPVCEFTHGYGSSPQNSQAVIRPLAAAGFVVPGPHFQHNFDDVHNGNTARDVSEILTRTLALNQGGDPLAGHIDAQAGLGVSGHSLGGMTTHGLLTAWPDSRVTAAIPMSCVDMGDPSGSVSAKTLFMHGDRDDTTAYSSARQAYSGTPAPKAFLTFHGGGHSSYFGDSRTVNTFVDWMRWGLYEDTAARDRLPSGAESSGTTWEFVGDDATGPAVHV